MAPKRRRPSNANGGSTADSALKAEINETTQALTPQKVIDGALTRAGVRKKLKPTLDAAIKSLNALLNAWNIGDAQTFDYTIVIDDNEAVANHMDELDQLLITTLVAANWTVKSLQTEMSLLSRMGIAERSLNISVELGFPDDQEARILGEVAT